MKKFVFQWVCFNLISFFLLFFTWGEALTLNESLPDSSGIHWKTCVNQPLEIKYLCREDWKVRDVDGSVLIIISSDPTVTLTITKIDSSVNFLSQLTQPALQDMDLYAEGFQTEQVNFAGRDALKVKAISKKYSDIRILDYFLVHDRNLYGVLFSVYPKEHWENYQFIIKKIVESFEFDNTPVVPTLTKGLTE